MSDALNRYGSGGMSFSVRRASWATIIMERKTAGAKNTNFTKNDQKNINGVFYGRRGPLIQYNIHPSTTAKNIPHHEFPSSLPKRGLHAVVNGFICEPTLMEEIKPTTPMRGGISGRFSLVWLWCGGHTEVGPYLGSTRNGVADLG